MLSIMSGARRLPLLLLLLALPALLLAACNRQAPTPEPRAPTTLAPATTPEAVTATPEVAATTSEAAPPDTGAEMATGGLIDAVRTDKARYDPGVAVSIAVELNNRSGNAYDGQIAVSFYHLGAEAAGTQTQPVAALAAGATSTLTFTWTPPSTDFMGYRVEVQALDSAGEAVLDTNATAVDISSDWTKFPRYGFVSHFDAAVDAADVMARLNTYHINAIQFYDWQWQHHRPYSPDETWPDIANRPVDRATVTALINEAHRYDMVAMSYNLAYGAYDNYWQDGSGVAIEWGLFNSSQGNYTPGQQDFHPLPAGWATSKLYLMNPADAEWQQYIFDQMQLVFDNFAFDGWHIDTLGKRNPAWSTDGQMVNMLDAFVDFTNNAKAALQKRLVFNTISGYGQDQIAESADVDVIYSEVWENGGIETYKDIADLVAQARAKTDKAMVIPAYMNKAYAQETPAGTTRFFNEHSVRLADAAIFAAGATHLELGDGDGMLSSEYFPSQPLVMSDTLKAAIHDYYDFLVAYENLLLDGVAEAENLVVLEGAPSSTNGKQGTIWTLVRSRPGYTILHLINLSGLRVSFWRDDGAVYPEPPTLSDLGIKVYTSDTLGEGARLWQATPDRGDGKAHELAYTTGSDDQGAFITFSLPSLQYWDLIWLEQ
jgi:dextranase